MKSFYLKMLMAVAAQLSAFAEARQFAIACDGVGTSADTVTGKVLRNTSKLPTNIYVVDDVDKSIKQALGPRQEFEEVCQLADGGQRSVDIAPGLIQVTYTGDFSAKAFTTCSFRVDRKTGTAKEVLKIEFSKTEYNINVWTMTCRPTVIPIFQPEKNKF